VWRLDRQPPPRGPSARGWFDPRDRYHPVGRRTRQGTNRIGGHRVLRTSPPAGDSPTLGLRMRKRRSADPTSAHGRSLSRVGLTLRRHSARFPARARKAVDEPAGGGSGHPIRAIATRDGAVGTEKDTCRRSACQRPAAKRKLRNFGGVRQTGSLAGDEVVMTRGGTFANSTRLKVWAERNSPELVALQPHGHPTRGTLRTAKLRVHQRGRPS